MDDQNPGSARSDRNASPAAMNPGGATNKPPAPTALSKVGEAAQQAGSQAREKAGVLAAEAGEKAKGVLGNQVEAGADFLGHISRSATAATSGSSGCGTAASRGQNVWMRIRYQRWSRT